MKKDVYGTPLNIDDKVVYKNSWGIFKGTVIGFTPKKIRVRSIFGESLSPAHVFPEEIVRCDW